MNNRRDWFLILGLVIGLLLVGGIYFLWPARKSITVAPNSPAAMVKNPISSPSSAGDSPAPSAAPARVPQPQVNSGPAPAYQYNARGQLQAIIYPDGSTYSYTYDASANKIRETSRTGKTWSYTYDQSHHPIAVIDPEGRVTHQQASPNAN
jgi:YD repeat-containing protein